jgi:ring-1,2-phenylacetyl-CoA epoxidase subunit PaaB
MSKLRQNVPVVGGDIEAPSAGDMRAYEVFVQVERGRPHVHCGSLEAPDDAMALYYAREHYGRDQACVQVWVVPRASILRTDYDKDLVFRLTDQSYRFAKGYDVRPKWQKFRDKKADAKYEKEDIKRHF